MLIKLWINGREYNDDVPPDTLLIDYLRQKGYYSVKRGCDTSNCGLCTVLSENRLILSCSALAVRANGQHITTLEGVQEEAEKFGGFLADEGGDQCGFCSPGFILSVIAMKRELSDPDEEKIKKFLEGNLCRCTGYQAQLRAIRKYLEI